MGGGVGRGPLTANLLKRYKALATPKGRRESGLFLVEGHRAIRQIIASRPDSISEIFATEVLAQQYSGHPVRVISQRQCESISLTKTPQGEVAVVRRPVEVETDRLPDRIGSHVLLLEDVQDPGNVGTLIRTAAAFGFSGVVLSGPCADPFSPKSVQAASGAVLSVWIRRTGAYLGLIRRLKDRRHVVATADVRGEDDPSVLRDRDRLLFAVGNEASGPSAALVGLSDHRFRIPVRPEGAASLNVAACGAIGMYLSTRLA